MFDWLKGAFAKKQTVNDTVEAYGKLLEEHPLSILDVSMLPLPKAEMKILLKALYAKTSNPQLAGHIETGFMSLSKFQQGVGAPVGAFQRLGTGSKLAEQLSGADVPFLHAVLAAVGGPNRGRPQDIEFPAVLAKERARAKRCFGGQLVNHLAAVRLDQDEGLIRRGIRERAAVRGERTSVEVNLGSRAHGVQGEETHFLAIGI